MMATSNNSNHLLYKQALIDPSVLREEELLELLIRYPYSQPLIFAYERRKKLLGQESPNKELALLYAQSENWLLNFVNKPVESLAQEITPSLAQEGSEKLSNELHNSSSQDISTLEIAEENLEPAAIGAEEIEQQEQKEEVDILEEQENLEPAATITEEIEQQEQKEEQEDILEEQENLEPATTVAEEIEQQEQKEEEEDILEEQENLEPAATITEEIEQQEQKEEQEDILESSETAKEHEALDRLVQEGSVGADYFVFDSFEKIEEAPKEDTTLIEQQNTEKDDVSLYNDDLMPYSFRWWLHKTRLEHADTYQPYASKNAPSLTKPNIDTGLIEYSILDQQIKENIINFQDPEEKLSEEVKKKPVIPVPPKKGADIIEKFMQKDPVIHPPSPENINNENMARQSAEDNYVFVTETLANIYIDQGLYLKAKEVFNKLILKYPEKKSYFATRIEELEKNL